MIEELYLILDYKKGGKINFDSSKEHKSSTKKEITHLIKDKEKGKVEEKPVINKVSCETMLLCYILVLARKEGQSSFSKDKKNITMELKNLDLVSH